LILNDTHLMIGTHVLNHRGVHLLVPETEKTTRDARKITVDDMKRILEVGRLLLSVLAQAEVELLTRHFRNGLPAHQTDHASVDATGESD
jgi:hypothetical protein